ncbi:hypothetical protein Acife_3121 [Acidithiobacillus ferrivorans SS3]|uniref:Uncharacterized protein n=1 Tax=Acidithiobacillus ferrivorans SS3 TaxID=743299 RepID=G0JL76_9PROT|nr:hypothetical protein Acife_3121 [Acidithiobacillus ferrivorans SS3]
MESAICLTQESKTLWKKDKIIGQKRPLKLQEANAVGC